MNRSGVVGAAALMLALLAVAAPGAGHEHRSCSIAMSVVAGGLSQEGQCTISLGCDDLRGCPWIVTGGMTIDGLAVVDVCVESPDIGTCGGDTSHSCADVGSCQIAFPLLLIIPYGHSATVQCRPYLLVAPGVGATGLNALLRCSAISV